MKNGELKQLKSGDYIVHKHFGKCKIKEIKYCGYEFFGLLLLPESEYGKALLTALTGMPAGTPVLEGSLRLVQLEKPLEQEAHNARDTF